MRSNIYHQLDLELETGILVAIENLAKLMEEYTESLLAYVDVVVKTAIKGTHKGQNTQTVIKTKYLLNETVLCCYYYYI